MPPDIAKIQAIVEDQQRALQGFVDHMGVGPVRRVYQGLMNEVTAKFRLAASSGKSFDMVRARGMLGQLQMGMARLVRQSAGVMGDAAYRIGMVSARNMLHGAAELESMLGGGLIESMPIMQIGRLHGLVKGQVSSVLQLHETSMARYGASVVQSFEQQIAAGLATGEPQHQIIDRVQRTADLRWSGAERIVRTELSGAYNGTARAVADSQAAELGGDMWTQWSEHVEGGVKLDDRVGVDSLAMHGQVAPPGGVFVQPPTAPSGGKEVSASLVGEEWTHPPNRPNDRAVLVPWRQHWGLPGWVWREGRRVRVTAAMAKRMSGAASASAPAPKPEPAPEAATPKAPPAVFAPTSHAPSPGPEPTPEIWTGPKKNPKRQAAARIAGDASAERRREIHSAVRSNLHPDLHVVWDKEGHKYMRQEGRRIRGIKDPINAASKISEAFAETYGSGDASVFGNEGDRFQKRAEIQADRAESWADDQEKNHYAEMQRAALDEDGELTEQGEAKAEQSVEEVDDWGSPIRAPKSNGDDVPF